MKNCHRRTESDNSLGMKPASKICFKLYFKQNNKDIPTLLKKTNRKMKGKTLFVESLDIPRSRSHQDLMFYFGRNDLDSLTSPTIITSQYDEGMLSPIPQKQHRCYTPFTKSKSKRKNKVLDRDCQSKNNLSLKHKSISSLHAQKSLNFSYLNINNQSCKNFKTKKVILQKISQKSKLVKNKVKKLRPS